MRNEINNDNNNNNNNNNNDLEVAHPQSGSSSTLPRVLSKVSCLKQGSEMNDFCLKQN